MNDSGAWRRLGSELGRTPRLVGVGLVAAGFAALAILVAPGDGRQPDLPPEIAEEPDAYVERGRIVEFGDDGAPRFTLQAEHIAYFEADALTRLDGIAVDLHRREGPPWRAVAARGELRPLPGEAGQPPNREQVLELAGGVELVGASAPNAAPVELRTDELRIYPTHSVVRTNRTVMIERGVGRTVAGGFEADLERGTMKLFSSEGQRVSIVAQPRRE